ncbi:hypothetical protein ACOSQB_02300 [Tenacibaculum sp. MEBiC07804]
MKTKTLNKSFYISITNLFYAFSMIDKKMSLEEKKEIVWSVKEEWATNEFGFNSEELIYETMRELIKENLSAEKAYENFKAYFIANKELFTRQINLDILDACHKICNATGGGKNKSELILLTKLHKLVHESTHK